MTIVIVEGIDRVGKTTLCKMFEQAGFFYFKDEWLLKDEMDSKVKTVQTRNYSLGKIDTTIAILKHFKANGMNVVVDRLHLTECVYGKQSRGYELDEQCILKLDRALANLGSTLIVVLPESIDKSSKEHGADLMAHGREFETRAHWSTIKQKVFTCYSRLADSFEFIMDETFEYDVYLASPFFTPEQVEREEFVKKSLREQGLKVFSPKENCFLSPTASHTAQRSVFNENCEGIRKCKAVLAITDTKDIGTIWEAGYAFAMGTPVIYYAETLGDRGFNLMLAQSGKMVIQKREDLLGKEIKECIRNGRKKFAGVIE